MRTKLAVAILCLALAFPTIAKDAGYTVIYDGGSIPGLKAGEKLKMYIESGSIQLTDEKGKTQVMSIVPSTVTEVGLTATDLSNLLYDKLQNRISNPRVTIRVTPRLSVPSTPPVHRVQN